MMDYTFHPEAAAELESAATYYDQRAGMGRELLDEIFRAISVIQKFPEAAPRVSEKSRRRRARRFPYGVVYRVKKDTIEILAVMHLHRKPGYWHHRE